MYLQDIMPDRHCTVHPRQMTVSLDLEQGRAEEYPQPTPRLTRIFTAPISSKHLECHQHIWEGLNSPQLQLDSHQAMETSSISERLPPGQEHNQALFDLRHITGQDLPHQLTLQQIKLPALVNPQHIG